MKGFMLGVLVLVGSSMAYAATNENDNDNDNENEQEQGQLQAQAAIAVQGQEQSQDQGNSQSIKTEGQRRKVVQSSPDLYLGDAQEGASVVTPYGSASAGKQAEMNKLAVAHSIVSTEEAKAEIEAQALEAIKPCRWLGVGPKRFSLLFGWDCLTSLRK